MLTKVISGGQTGVDQAGLRAARKCGIPTGGMAPLGYWTEKGFMLWLKSSYGLIQAKKQGYVERTRYNVENSDLTIMIVSDFTSAGSRCTKGAIKLYHKPYINIGIDHLDEYMLNVAASTIGKMDVKIVNIAGNRESVCPGIGALAEEWLTNLFTIVNKG